MNCHYKDGQNWEHWQHKIKVRIWSNRNSYLLLTGMQIGLNTLLSHNIAMVVLGVYLKNLKLSFIQKTCTYMVIAVLLLSPKLGINQDPPSGRWINK